MKSVIRLLTGFVLLLFVLTFSKDLNAQCTVVITANQPCVCTGGAVTLMANVTGGTAPYTYLWSDGATTNPNSNVGAGTYTVTVTGTGCGSITSPALTVTSYPPPDATFTISPNPPQCGNTPLTFTPSENPSGNPAPDFLWEFTDLFLTPITIPSSNQSSPTPNLSKIGYGTFDVKVKLTVTRCGCSTSTEQTITVKELPNADLTATPANWTQCNSSNPSFPLSVFPVINDPLKNATYKIAWGDGTYTPPVGVNNFPYSAAIPHTYSTYNKWTLTHTVTSATNGCTNVKTYPVFNGSNPVPVLSCPATILPACIPPPVSLVIPYDPNYTDNSPGTICEFTYFDNDPAHYPKTQTTLVEELPAVFTVDYETSSCGYTVSSPSPFAGSTNIFAIRCKVTNQCVTAGIAPPMIHDCYTGTYGGKPVPDFQFKSSTGQVITSGCLYDDITLNSTTAPTNSGTVLCDNNATRTYHWTITPNTYTPISGWDNTVSPVVKFTANGIYDVTLEVSNACPGAAASITRQICIDNLSPVAAFTVPADPLNPSNCSPFTFTPDITGSSAADGCGVVNYQWSVTYAGGTCPNSGGAPTWVTGNATSAAPTIKLIDPGNYTITLMVSNSCGTSVPSTQNVTVKGKPVVTITPPGSPPNYGPFCEGGTFHFCMNIQDCYGTVNPSSKSWRLNGVSAGTGDCVDLTGLAAGSYSLTAEAENECGIGVSAPFIFTVSPVPIPTINGPGIVNQGAVACYITEPGMVFYNWTIQGGGSFSGGMLTNTCCVNWGGVGLGQVCVSYAGGLNNCNANTPTCMNVTINPCPTVQTVTLTRHGTNPTVVGNDFCMGDPGIDVCLTASESGIVYKLFDSFGTQWGTNLVGPSGGGSICFTPPVNVPGFFYITATNTSSLCTINFPSFQIFSISPPAIVAITPQGPECEDLPQGVPLGLSMWQTGIDYEWNFNGDSWNSSGGPPILTQAIATGTYCARAVDPFTQCVSNTLNCVDIMPQPMAINAIAPQGVMPVCQNIFLPVSQSGFEYKLINRTIGSVITWSPATGSSHWFNNICEPGLYEIEARNINTPPYCTRVMDWSLFLYECATPFVVNPIGSQCQGVHVYLSNSEIDVVYELKETNSGTVKQNILSTNGGPLDFGVLDYTYPEGIYKIFAKQSVFPGSGDTCITEMFGQIDLCEKPLPKVISPSGNVCNVASITLFNSDPGVTYHLMHWGNDPVQSLTGNGAMLIFNSINNNPPFNQPFFPNGIYHIKAVKSCTGVQCETTFESINVEPGPQINAGADITTCAGPSNTIYINDATAIYYSSVLWTDLSGLGTFTPNNVLNPIYTSGSIPGTRVLRMQVAGLPCFETTVFDEKIINVLPTPELTSTLNPPPICTGQTFNYTPTSLTTGTIFTWSRASLPGILEPSTSGSGNISEVLTNITGIPIDVTYIYSLTSGDCLAQTNYNLVVTVFPVPVIPNQLESICSGQNFSIVPTNSPPVTIVPSFTIYSWSAPVVNANVIGGTAGISQLSITGTLFNLTNTLQTAVYTVTPTSILGGNCVGAPFIITVLVYPLNSSLISDSVIGSHDVCAGSQMVPYSTIPVSGATNYSWMLPLGATIATGAGTNSITVNFPNFTGSGVIKVTPFNDCGSGVSSSSFPVRINPPLSGSFTLSNMTIQPGQSGCIAADSIFTGGISGSFAIPNTARVKLIAEKAITLLNGTTVSPGGYLSAVITNFCIPCGNNKSLLTNPDDQEDQLADVDITSHSDDVFFKVYPNPAHDRITVELMTETVNGGVEMTLYDIYGRLAESSLGFDHRKYSFSVENLSPGVYVMLVRHHGLEGKVKIVRIP